MGVNPDNWMPQRDGEVDTGDEFNLEDAKEVEFVAVDYARFIADKRKKRGVE